MARQEDKLKKVLTRKDVLGMAFGQIIGAGIMSLTGIAIGMTGTGVIFAFILSSFITIFTVTPEAVLGSTFPTTGGNYRYVSRLISPKIGFFYLLLYIFAQVSISMYALSFADYAVGLIPGINKTLVAAIVLTVLYIFNYVGMRSAANVQNVMVVTLLCALLCFTLYGLPKVDFANVFNTKNMFPNGIVGFLTATSLLSFGTGGAQVIVEVGGEMKTPEKDIPFTIIVSTICCGILYALMSSVAAGVLPIEQVANKPLTDVAKDILPHALFLFFMIGGAMFALASTLNSTLSWVTKSLIVACDDGWLSKSLGVVHDKFGTPTRLLTIFYIIGLIPIVTGISLETVSKLGTGASCLIKVFPAIASLYLPLRFPEEYKKSTFPIKYTPYKIIATIAIIACLMQSYLLFRDLPRSIQLGSLVIIVLAVIATYIKGNSMEKQGKLDNLGF